MELREIEDYQVMERLRRRVESIVKDKTTAEALKPWYRFLCKRPCSNDEYLPTFNRPNVTLVDVSATKGVERMTETGFVADGVEYEVDCMIFASGFEITTELERRWGIDPIRAAMACRSTITGPTVPDAPRHDDPRFPQPVLHRLHPGRRVGEHDGDVRAAGRHIAHVIKERWRAAPRPSSPANRPRTSGSGSSGRQRFDPQFSRECTPGYYNNEGEEQLRSNLGEPYGPGFYAFDELLQEWRDRGDLKGLALGT